MDIRFTKHSQENFFYENLFYELSEKLWLGRLLGTAWPFINPVPVMTLFVVGIVDDRRSGLDFTERFFRQWQHGTVFLSVEMFASGIANVATFELTYRASVLPRFWAKLVSAFAGVYTLWFIKNVAVHCHHNSGKTRLIFITFALL